MKKLHSLMPIMLALHAGQITNPRMARGRAYRRGDGIREIEAAMQEAMDTRSNYEAFESEEGFEAEYFSPKHVMGKALSRQRPAAQPRSVGGKAMSRVGGGGPRMGGGGMSATINLSLTRETVNIAQDVIVPVFGTIAIASGYSGLLQLPAGMSISDVTNGQTSGALAEFQRTRVSFLSGGATDIVTIVSTGGALYPELLQALNTDMFHVSRIRYQISNATEQRQLATEMRIIRKSLFGARDEQTLPLGTFNDPNANKTNVMDIDVDFAVDKETTLGIPIINAAAGPFTVNMSLFITWFAKHNAR